MYVQVIRREYLHLSLSSWTANQLGEEQSNILNEYYINKIQMCFSTRKADTWMEYTLFATLTFLPYPLRKLYHKTCNFCEVHTDNSPDACQTTIARDIAHFTFCTEEREADVINGTVCISFPRRKSGLWCLMTIIGVTNNEKFDGKSIQANKQSDNQWQSDKEF